MVVEEGRVIKTGLINELLKEIGLIQKMGLSQVQNKMSALIIQHDVENGCTLVETPYGIELILPLRADLPRGSWITVALSSNEIALSRHYLAGISIQNQVKGRICALIPSDSGMLVQIDCGNTWIAGISLKACHDMKLKEGEAVYCLAKTQAFSYWSTVESDVFNPLFENRKIKPPIKLVTG
jgi:molybdate transport system ATP-binding protein